MAQTLNDSVSHPTFTVRNCTILSGLMLDVFYPVKYLQKVYVNPMNLVYSFRKLTKYTELTGGINEKCIILFNKMTFFA